MKVPITQLDALMREVDHRMEVAAASVVGRDQADVRKVLKTLRIDVRSEFEGWKLQREADYQRHHIEILFRLCLGLLALLMLLQILFPSVY